MTQPSDLDALLDDTTPEPMDTPEVPRETIDQGDKEQAVEPPSTPLTPAPEPEHVPRAALQDERRKRQQIEKQFAELQQRLQQQPQQEQQRPDWFADPERAAQMQRHELDRQIFETRLELSESIIAEKYQDYAEIRDVFADAAARDPSLAAQLIRQPNPAKYAYEVGKYIASMREIGTDPAAYRERVRAEVMKELGHTQEQGGQPQRQLAAPSAPVPKSLAKAPSAQPRAPSGQFASNGPTPLSEIID